MTRRRAVGQPPRPECPAANGGRVGSVTLDRPGRVWMKTVFGIPRWFSRVLPVALSVVSAWSVGAQPRPQRDTVLAARRDSLERELERIAVIDRKLMVPMRDGAKMQFD